MLLQTAFYKSACRRKPTLRFLYPAEICACSPKAITLATAMQLRRLITFAGLSWSDKVQYKEFRTTMHAHRCWYENGYSQAARLFLADMGLQFDCSTALALFITRLLGSLIEPIKTTFQAGCCSLEDQLLVTMISCYLQASGQPWLHEKLHCMGMEWSEFFINKNCVWLVMMYKIQELLNRKSSM